MKILDLQMYLDGGTIEIVTDKGTFCIDGRPLATKGKVYKGFPKSDNSNIIENYKDIEKEITESLKDYNNDFYEGLIKYLIENGLKSC